MVNVRLAFHRTVLAIEYVASISINSCLKLICFQLKRMCKFWYQRFFVCSAITDDYHVWHRQIHILFCLLFIIFTLWYTFIAIKQLLVFISMLKIWLNWIMKNEHSSKCYRFCVACTELYLQMPFRRERAEIRPKRVLYKRPAVTASIWSVLNRDIRLHRIP